MIHVVCEGPQPRLHLGGLYSDCPQGTSQNLFSAVFRVWTKSNWQDFRWLPSGSHAQNFLHWSFCPCAENPSDRILRDTLKKDCFYLGIHSKHKLSRLAVTQ